LLSTSAMLLPTPRNTNPHLVRQPHGKEVRWQLPRDLCVLDRT
jgi:hypothetical protein